MKHTIQRVVVIGRVALILSWAAFLSFAWFTTQYPRAGKPGRLGIINPSYRWLSLASAATLILVGGALLPAQRDEPAGQTDDGSAREGEDNHDHEDQEAASPGELAFQALFLAPIVLSLCTTGSGLSGTSVARRGVHEIRLPGQSEIRSPTPSAESGGVQPPLTMADLYEYLLTGAPAHWAGRPVDVTGQYFVDERCGENQFIVTRIVVTCCLADAEVMGVRVQSSKPFQPAARLTKPAPWIEVHGKLEALNDRFGNRALFIGDPTVSEVPPPDDILLYPRRRRAPW
jgi:uncharacterized repeat protein (TIGR03943 family)